MREVKKLQQFISLVLPMVAGVCAVALALAAIPAMLQAHKGATGVVKKRMDAMKDMGKDMKALSFMVSGRRPYSVKRARSAAERIAGHAGRAIKLFPKGSLKQPSEALPSIWKNWDEFERFALDLIAAAKKLDGAAQAGTERARPIVAEIGAACSGCHKKFRQEK